MRHTLQLFILILVTTIFLPSCNSSTFDISKEFKKLENPCDLFQKIELIPLESNESSLIGSINKVQITDTFVYVLDRIQNIILVFDNDGKFNKKFSKIGKGPGEYVNLMDFHIYKDGSIEILTNYKLILYDKNYNLVNQVELPRIAHFFYRLDKTFVALYHLQAENRITVINTKNNMEVCSGIYIPKYARSMPVNPFYSPFYLHDNGVYLGSTFTNDIFKISSTGIEKSYTFFPDNSTDLSKLPQNKNQRFYIQLVNNLSNPIISDVYQSNACLKFFIRIKGEGFFCISNLKSKKSFHFKTVADNIKYFGRFVDEKFIYGTMDISDAFTYINNKSISDLISIESFNKIKANKESMNPILVKYYLK